jgi:P4 family phage/plasmid primase-like protien
MQTQMIDKKKIRESIVQNLLKKYTFATLENTREMFMYEDGVYVGKGNPERIIAEKAREVLGDECSKNDIAEIVNTLQIETFVDADFFDRVSKDLVCVSNGVLKLQFDSSLKTNLLESKCHKCKSWYNPDAENALHPCPYEDDYSTRIDPTTKTFNYEELVKNCPHFEEVFVGFLSHDKNTPFLNKIPVDYNPNAECPANEKFLHEILDSEEDVQAIFEFAGYCLYRDMPNHTSFLFIGEGSNGKSTLLRLLTVFLGEENVSHLELQNFHRFNVAELRGKLANFCSDLPEVALVDTGLFKQLTGNDFIDAELKFVQRHVTFTNHAKMAYSCNKIPENRNDDSLAYWRRWILFNFTKVFDGEHGNEDKKILEKLTTPEEMSGFLNKVLEGLQRLLKNGKFSNDKGTEYTKMMWTANDTVKIFSDECLEVETSAYVPMSNVYEAYLEFCRERKFSGYEDNKVFGRKLHRYVRCFANQKTIENMRIWCYQGFRLKAKEQTQIQFGDSNATN